MSWIVAGEAHGFGQRGDLVFEFGLGDPRGDGRLGCEERWSAEEKPRIARFEMRQIEIVAGDDLGRGVKFVAELIEPLLGGLQLCLEPLGLRTVAACGRWSWRFGSRGL